LNGQIYSAAKLHAARAVLDNRQIEVAHMFEGTGLVEEDLFRDGLKISLHQILRAFKNISEKHWYPELPYEIGRRLHVSSYGLYGYAVLCSENIADAVEFAQRFHTLAAPTALMQFHDDPSEAGWDIEPIANPLEDSVFRVFLINLQIGIFTSMHRDVMGPRFTPHLIELGHGPDAPYQLPQKAADTVQMNCARNRYHVHRKWLDRKLRLGNPIVFREMTQICETELAAFSVSSGVAQEVRQILQENADLSASMAQVADAMGVTSRTLRRRLKRESTTFSDIANGIRAEEARRYLSDARMRVEDIAYVLGFSESASFVRAFKRWTGKTPNEYRLTPDL